MLTLVVIKSYFNFRFCFLVCPHGPITIYVLYVSNRESCVVVQSSVTGQTKHPHAGDVHYTCVYIRRPAAALPHQFCPQIATASSEALTGHHIY